MSMAYIDDNKPIKEEELNQGASALSASAGSAQPHATSSSAPNSNNFAGIKDYLNANQGQGQAMADNLYGQVRKEGDAVTGAIDSADKTFQSQYKPSDYDASKVTQSLATLGTDPSSQSYLSKQLSGSYTGPSAGDYTQASNLLTKAQGDYGLTQSDSGRQALLARTYGNSTTGGHALDSALLSQAHTSDALAKQYAGLSGQLTDARARNASNVTQANQDYDNARTQTLSAIQDADKAALSGLHSKLSQAQLGTQAALKEQTSNPLNLSDEERANAKAWGLDPSIYLSSQGPTNIGQVTAPEDVARLNALGQLANDPTLSGLKGNGGTQGSVTFDKTAFNKEYEVAKAAHTPPPPTPHHGAENVNIGGQQYYVPKDPVTGELDYSKKEWNGGT